MSAMHHRAEMNDHHYPIAKPAYGMPDRWDAPVVLAERGSVVSSTAN
ncbi:MAG: hypothetical protein ACYCS7_07880 [Acidimicrobiales bacterium]